MSSNSVRFSSSSSSGDDVATKLCCSGCKQAICDKYYLKAIDKYWHDDCLKCDCCDCKLGEIGCKLYIKANLILCRKDYLRLFGQTGLCGVCNKTIQAYELVMKFNSIAVHLECFQCTTCNKEFCVGDKFYVNEMKIYCENDYINLKSEQYQHK